RFATSRARVDLLEPAQCRACCGGLLSRRGFPCHPTEELVDPDQVGGEALCADVQACNPVTEQHHDRSDLGELQCDLKFEEMECKCVDDEAAATPQRLEGIGGERYAKRTRGSEKHVRSKSALHGLVGVVAMHSGFLEQHLSGTLVREGDNVPGVGG